MRRKTSRSKPLVESEFPVHLFRYDPETGIITRDGKPRGCVSVHGYLRICGGWMQAKAHRLAWRLFYGEWPEREIDHVNGITSDNRISNLRQASRSQNLHNRRFFSRNTSGEPGVSRNRTKWRVKVDTRSAHVDEVATHFVSAVVAARLIRRTLHGEFYRPPQEKMGVKVE